MRALPLVKSFVLHGFDRFEYTYSDRAEDRALLGSNPSADSGAGVWGTRVREDLMDLLIERNQLR
jgi:hypothetical protein